MFDNAGSASETLIINCTWVLGGTWTR